MPKAQEKYLNFAFIINENLLNFYKNKFKQIAVKIITTLKTKILR